MTYYKGTTRIVYTVDNVQKIVTVTNVFNTRKDHINKLQRA